MKKSMLSGLTGLLLLCLGLAGTTFLAAQTTDDSSKFLTEKLYPATVLLYSQDDSGSMKMRCTATSIEKNAKGYVFVTAAHCGCEDDTEKKTVSPEKTFFYVTSDEDGAKKFSKADPVGCGYRHKGDDFMLFQVDTEAIYPVIPLGEDPKIMDQVINVASPQGLGKQVFTGSISSAKLDRAVIDGDINWTGVVLLQMFGVNGGSSGSSVLCVGQKAICAFVVGSIGETTMTAMPVSRLRKLQAGLADGTYKYWVKDPDTVPTKSVDKVKK